MKAITKYTRFDRYEMDMKFNNRFLHGIRILLTGKTRIHWYVSAENKRKGVYLKGKKV